MQTRRASAVEAAVNVLVGYGLSTILTVLLLNVPPGQAGRVSAVFTAASLARSYALRRLFIRWQR